MAERQQELSKPASKRRFHIPTVEEIEKSRAAAEERLTPSTIMQEAALDLSTSILQSPEAQQSGSTSCVSDTQKQPAPDFITARAIAKTTAASPQAMSRPSGPRNYSSQVVQVNELQRGNPLLASIRNVRWSFAKDIVPDYVVGGTTCILYLSIKYHRLHPEYIAKRIEGLGKNYSLRVLLVLADTDDSKLPLREINRAALLGNMTILLAWSLDEAGRYIEALKMYEHRPPDAIKERIEDTYMARLNNALTSVRSVNKTDVLTLASNFGSFEGMAKASADELTLCPGIGDLKAQRLFKAMNDLFVQNS
ncbi:ssDNA endonuclease and repair protein rad10 [Coemansia sp. RSA 1813]|nr:ssDNA endonuclease and repair protein rad10 [Coemansia sp. RSA 1646]KAJ1768879.1 ssDNA endonuclease and repair protein rad10 [Coemansia sp. RSA 1843]KAJ2088728.1 ssDNA endonuclease and repair protein rad10 [Coemansia sp. RSA 986]KAJ2213653.1 ssDNA endonuclease and repair protein rad10 [Coemansia sp. RSA 487]KAJ2568630.1 ssDNA endonuclease and repair protein rad10 [Coemansia sp. RSA 1813]